MNSSFFPAGPQSMGAAGRYRIGKAFTFEASHRLPADAAPRWCIGAHGHSYTVGVVLGSGTLMAPGFVTDFGDLDPFKRYLAETLDHRDLNEILDTPPTRSVIEDHLTSWLADNLAQRISGRVEAVRVSNAWPGIPIRGIAAVVRASCGP
jgi:6-pyruvoyltetrahydropterin/6-carboxytetrahydropterin synthase